MKSINKTYSDVLRNCLVPVRKRLVDFHRNNEQKMMFHTKFNRVKELLLNWYGQNEEVKILILFGRYFDQLASEILSFLSIEKKLKVKCYPSHEVRFYYGFIFQELFLVGFSYGCLSFFTTAQPAERHFAEPGECCI